MAERLSFEENMRVIRETLDVSEQVLDELARLVQERWRRAEVDRRTHLRAVK